MVKVLFITDKAKYSRKLLFFNLFLDHYCLLYPMLQAVFFTDEAKYSRKLHFLFITIVSSVCVCGCVWVCVCVIFCISISNPF